MLFFEYNRSIIRT